ncbi:MAG: glycosyltransferase family 2 protein [Clostridia bacterium]|nr:glycosyltransferase family 2 protein [Clostridia bacterium]
MKSPFFSVIVPAYNTEKLISGCIESVLSQTESDFELILVNDGSQDATPEILDAYAKKDNRITVFHQENGGHTAARNKGLAESHGEYVLFLDCDDGLEPDVLETCKQSICKHNSDIVVFGICKITGETRSFYQNLVPDGVYPHANRNETLLKQLLLSETGSFTFPKSLSGKAFRRELAEACQLSVPKTILMGEDGLSFISAVLHAETITVCSRANYLYFIREDSISHKGDRYAFQRFFTLLEYYRDQIIPLHPLMEKQFDRFVVAQLDTASRFMMRSGCDRKYFRQEWKQISSVDFIHYAIRNAEFSKTAWKLKLKQLILRYSLFGIGKLLLR